MPEHRASHPDPGPFAEFLEPGEVVLWRGAPVRGLRLAPARDDLKAGATGLAATSGFALLAWLTGGLQEPGLVMALVLTLVFGLGCLALYPIALKHRLRAHRLVGTRFAVTDRRMLRLAPGRTSPLRALAPGPGATLSLSDGGAARTLSVWQWPEGAHRETPAEALDFEFLENPRVPHELIRKMVYAPS